MYLPLRFITLCEYLETRKVPPRIGEGNMDKEMKKALAEIHLSDIEPLIKHLPMILDKLLELMVTTYKVGGETLILDSTVFVTLCQISQKFSVSDHQSDHKAFTNGSHPFVTSSYVPLTERRGPLPRAIWPGASPQHLCPIPSIHSSSQ